MKPPARHCAVYTRKSSEEGLEQDFNSLDAQKEACLAFITSQKAEGWLPVRASYDDGGFSGGNMDRPGLKKLMEDILAGKVNIIVVYKIDRLTRSLMDFAKLVEVFDRHNVTFVSVTQSFNTTTSMGRLTLNVLLSFAQFEREVTGERIRDKIAASKKRGMWMGGNPPIGYMVSNRQLVVDEEGAKTANHIFERYLVLGCVSGLKRELDQKGVKSKIRVSERGWQYGGSSFSRGALNTILANPAYIGKVRHRHAVYDGQHQPIIPKKIWDAVQAKLQGQAATPRRQKKYADEMLLRGKLFGYDGMPYSPTFTNKSGRRYRYYVSGNFRELKDHPKGVIARMPAVEIEEVVVKGIREALSSRSVIAGALSMDAGAASRELGHILKNHSTISPGDLVSRAVDRIIVDQQKITIQIIPSNLKSVLQDHLDITLPQHSLDDIYSIEVPFQVQKSYRGAVVIRPDQETRDRIFDRHPQELKNLIRGIIWRDEHFQGLSIREIARREGLNETYVGRLVRESFSTLQS